MEALRVAPPLEHPAGELVDDQQLAVADDVLLVLAVERVRLQRLDQVVDEVAVDVQVEVLDAERLLDLVDAALGGRRGAVLLVNVVVLVLLEGRDDPGEAVVGVGGRLRDARDDERRTGLVDEDRVDLVHDAEVVAALDAVGQPDRHVVAQVVEAELGVGAVGDVGRVGVAPRGLGHHRRDHADRDAEPLVDRRHPLGVAAGQVVVDRDEVDPAAEQRVQVDGRHRGQGLALAGLHLGDAPLVQRHGPDQLHVEHPQAEAAHPRLAGDGERLVDQVLELGPVGEAGLELVGLGAQLLVAELLHLRLELADRQPTRLCMRFIERPSPTRRTRLIMSVLMQGAPGARTRAASS